jgi:hypothetical protein
MWTPPLPLLSATISPLCIFAQVNNSAKLPLFLLGAVKDPQERKVKKRLTPAETAKPENADCRFWVTFKNSETGGVLPACIGMSARNCAAAFAAALAPEMRACGGEAGGGGDCRWALLRQSA